MKQKSFVSNILTCVCKLGALLRVANLSGNRGKIKTAQPSHKTDICHLKILNQCVFYSITCMLDNRIQLNFSFTSSFWID